VYISMRCGMRRGFITMRDQSGADTVPSANQMHMRPRPWHAYNDAAHLLPALGCERRIKDCGV
jgi:hypothetical protein